MFSPRHLVLPFQFKFKSEPSDVFYVPVFAAMIGSSSHCIINVNLAGPSLVQTENHSEQFEAAASE